MDWFIINGIISIAGIALSAIIAFVIIEKKIVSVNQSRLIYALIFFGEHHSCCFSNKNIEHWEIRIEDQKHNIRRNGFLTISREILILKNSLHIFLIDKVHSSKLVLQTPLKFLIYLKWLKYSNVCF